MLIYPHTHTKNKKREEKEPRVHSAPNTRAFCAHRPGNAHAYKSTHRYCIGIHWLDGVAVAFMHQRVMQIIHKTIHGHEYQKHQAAETATRPISVPTRWGLWAPDVFFINPEEEVKKNGMRRICLFVRSMAVILYIVRGHMCAILSGLRSF